ncbi:unnamed protein product [Fusarium venenatum]|uniref:Uncharacterized protein n=1 Tax=Fusarium venenatum TaxID=56646 RepID=A0A2L2SS44_9HYPO|nr:uncharacterized protein FVRRES_12602 [Fusarium venenatum]CEI39911.1 unnamed protein product [Fusarium venenatum]
MRSFVLNNVGMKYLSACWQDSCLTLFAHYPDSSEIQYQDYGNCGDTCFSDPTWLHFVLDESERITEIWRWQKHSRRSDIVGESGLSAHRLLRKHGTEITSSISLLENHLLSTLMSHGGVSTNQPFMLTGLSTITPCWLKEKYGKHMIGFVFVYGDGCVRTIGQVRLDSLAKPIDITASSGMSLKERGKYSRKSIVDVKISTRKVEAEGWRWFPWKGRMTWWDRPCGGVRLFHEV